MKRQRESRPEDPWTVLIVFVAITAVVLGFLKAHLNTFFSIAYGLAFFGLAFSLGIVILPCASPKFREQTGPLGENLLRLAVWGGEAAAVIFTQFSEARMEFLNLGNVAKPLALAALLLSMFFLLLTDIGSIWTALSSARNRLPPRLVHSWWGGRWFFYLAAFLLLAIAFAVSAGLLPQQSPPK